MPGAPVFETSYSTTEVNKSGSRVYDDAWVKGGVEITRRGQRFVLLRQDYLSRLIEEARDDRPQSLDDLLQDYDTAKIRNLTADFEAEPPTGTELI
ncbi:hypothetical protein [Magnetospirillum moscoviense]|uniref:Antitoxin n=1 Tax=Magnetospirillum moscoviense TaxID=1437059 RepID=A0A178MHX3_9PROT|nr:hypothetical protein [Magnetospirillum moscoviense]MBF0324032.1 hypothetical protein [Alphaproteobacteria bacterium]OAN47728.1 hypothetical protein A6A05_15405 [Magnetospirillum moscoviense]